ncbi:MAG: SDR family NAD(P)-dependent oxidoreductase [Parvibaculales bacterium]
MGKLDGKAAIIIGAAGKDNMGQIMARHLQAEGADVLVAGRHEDALKECAESLTGHYALCDITKKSDIDDMAASALDKMGRVDIAINATGWGLLKPFLDNEEDELRQMTDLQFIGPFMFYQAMIRAMMQTGGSKTESGGSLIQISSATATIQLNDHAAYMGTKAGADHVIRCIANEFGSHGIRANSISPGLTDTPMTAGAKETPGLFESFLPSYPLGRIGSSEDIAHAAVWLSSDECYMSGENLQVNGGLCLRGNPSNADMAASIEKHMQAD